MQWTIRWIENNWRGNKWTEIGEWKEIKNGQTINLSPLVSLNEEVVGEIEMMSRWSKVSLFSVK